jgi:hypothetical protein
LAGFFAAGGGDGRLRSGLRWGCGDETMSLLAGGALMRMLFLAAAFAAAVLAGTY